MKDDLDKYFSFAGSFPELFNNKDAEIRIITDIKDVIAVKKSLELKYRDCPEKQRIGIVFDGPFFKVIRDPVQFPDGSYGAYTRFISTHNPLSEGVVVLPIFQDKVLFIKQYRHSVRGWRWELPRGFVNSGETKIEAARREFYEETSILSNDFQFIGAIEPDSGAMVIAASVYRTTIEPPSTAISLGTDEEAISEMRLFSGEEIKNLILKGLLVDGFSLSALTIQQVHNS